MVSAVVIRVVDMQQQRRGGRRGDGGWPSVQKALNERPKKDIYTCTFEDLFQFRL